MRALRWTPTALVAGVLTLTFAGSATATALITGAQVKDETVTGHDLANGSVTHADVKPAGLSAHDLRADAVPPPGAPGPAGPAGEVGPTGARGVSDVRSIGSHLVALAAGQYAEIPVNCPGRHRVAHGGASASSGNSGLRIQESAPNDAHTSWVVRVVNDGLETTSVQAWALCIDVG